MTYTLTNTTDGITAGSIYTFKYIAFNVKGFSAFSNEVRFAAAQLPAKPNPPVKVLGSSTNTSITVSWS